MSAAVGVVCFPGTNCEHDVAQALERCGAQATIIWHDETDLSRFDRLVVPGGFAHGDYLRPGAIARFSPVMAALERFAAGGGPVLGICNGFQVLTEAGLLPGALVRNDGLRFLCRTVECLVDSTDTVLTEGLERGVRLALPINHYEGHYVCDDETFASLVDGDRILLRYVDNPNGSRDSIAGIASKAGNVVGLMPHPERAADPLGVGTDGLVLLRAFVSAPVRSRAAAGLPT